MERIGLLIDKLKQQFEIGVNTAALLNTVNLLRSELEQKQGIENNITANGASEDMALEQNSFGGEKSRVAVILPMSYRMASMQQQPPVIKQEEETISQPQMEKQTSDKVVYELVPSTEFEVNDDVEVNMEKEINIPTYAEMAGGESEDLNMHLSNLQQKTSQSESLNDKLKLSENNFQQAIKEPTVTDLRQAIGINDRYLFINELFRGDEAMYERSIKTINNFGHYTEAIYWINRELKLKLGWKQNNDIVENFDQLIKRRFS